MVGRMLLLKMLHCRRTNGRKTSRTVETLSNAGHSSTTRQKKPQEIIMKKECNDGNMCRVCLTEGCIPIYGNDMFGDISESLNTFSGIEISINDPYPKFLCQACYELLQNAILLRKTAQDSDKILKHCAKDLVSENEESVDCFNEDNNSFEYEESKDKMQMLNYHCKKCEISFNTFKEYSNHKLSEEHENMRLVCPVCNNSYTAMYLKKHLALHKQEASYVCDICGKNFVMQSQFTRHRVTHFYELPFQCALCPYKGRFKESLKMHMRSHTGEKPYQCTQCPSRFISKSNLNKHSLTHKSDHDFKCGVCERGFNIKRALDLHYKVDHNGIKDHVCNICGKAFGYRKQMMKHQLKVHKRAKLRSGRMPLYLKVETMKQQDPNVSTAN